MSNPLLAVMGAIVAVQGDRCRAADMGPERETGFQFVRLWPCWSGDAEQGRCRLRRHRVDKRMDDLMDSPLGYPRVRPPVCPHFVPPGEIDNTATTARTVRAVLAQTSKARSRAPLRQLPRSRAVRARVLAALRAAPALSVRNGPSLTAPPSCQAATKGSRRTACCPSSEGPATREEEANP